MLTANEDPVLVPVTLADGLSGDLDQVTPLLIPHTKLDTAPQEVMSEETQTLSQDVSIPPTLASTGFRLPTPLLVGEPANSEPIESQTSALPLGPDPPTENPEPQTERPDPLTESPQVLLLPKEGEAQVKQVKNDTAMFSAGMVLSGDGEVDHAPSPSPQFLDTDTERDSPYDQDEGFLPVSSDFSSCLHTALNVFIFLVWRIHFMSSYFSCPAFPSLHSIPFFVFQLLVSIHFSCSV